MSFRQVYTVDTELRMVEETKSRAQSGGFQNLEERFLPERTSSQRFNATEHEKQENAR